MYVTKTIVGRDWRVVEISEDAETTTTCIFPVYSAISDCVCLLCDSTEPGNYRTIINLWFSVAMDYY